MGADGYCDYSFDGSDSITFQDMTVIGSVYPDGTIKAEDTQGLRSCPEYHVERLCFQWACGLLGLYIDYI